MTGGMDPGGATMMTGAAEAMAVTWGPQDIVSATWVVGIAA